jgi:hypothetical protein
MEQAAGFTASIGHYILTMWEQSGSDPGEEVGATWSEQGSNPGAQTSRSGRIQIRYFFINSKL